MMAAERPVAGEGLRYLRPTGNARRCEAASFRERTDTDSALCPFMGAPQFRIPCLAESDDSNAWLIIGNRWRRSVHGRVNAGTSVLTGFVADLS